MCYESIVNVSCIHAYICTDYPSTEKYTALANKHPSPIEATTAVTKTGLQTQTQQTPLATSLQQKQIFTQLALDRYTPAA